MRLRGYQQDAVDAACAWMRKSVMPGLLELATGAGKSHIVAAIAQWVHDASGKRVLCLAPSKELTEQNHEKYRATGNPASIFSASAGSKCLRHPVVYGTPGTVKNSLSRFGDHFGAIIIDEAHGITETIKIIVGEIQKKNPKVRVIGMTATPYRTNSGYIYQYDQNGQFMDSDVARDPWFNTLLYRIDTRTLIDMGYLTPAHSDPDHAESYAADTLEVNARGQFDADQVERVFEGQGRLTAEIVADVIDHARGRRGVMLFAATVQHAKEVMQSLPPSLSRMIGGDVNMGKTERERVISEFKSEKFKYLVSVGTLTTGFDAPHVDLIAALRATESPGLFQQIIGRGLRLSPGKDDCLILDYARNIERHSLQDDLFAPEIRARGSEKTEGGMEVKCPDCNHVNQFGGRPNPDGFEYSEDGYFVDLAGDKIETDHGPMPSHFGRRCTGQVKSHFNPGIFDRCDYRWTSKKCESCDADNDIAARYCCACKQELVDPNERLTREFMRVKRDPHQFSTDKVLSWDVSRGVSKKGHDNIRVDFVTDCRTVTAWYTPGAGVNANREWEKLSSAVFRGRVAPDVDAFWTHLSKGDMPTSIRSAKIKGSKFFEIIGYNLPVDEAPQ